MGGIKDTDGNAIHKGGNLLLDDPPWFGRKMSSALCISMRSVCGLHKSRDLAGNCIHVFGAQESDWKLLAYSGT